MVLRGGWFVFAMMLLRLAQKLCQSRYVQIAESTSGQASCDLLEQPGVAIRVAERSKGKVAAVVVWCMRIVAMRAPLRFPGLPGF